MRFEDSKRHFNQVKGVKIAYLDLNAHTSIFSWNTEVPTPIDSVEHPVSTFSIITALSNTYQSSELLRTSMLCRQCTFFEI
jgi:hypothetical protein